MQINSPLSLQSIPKNKEKRLYICIKVGKLLSCNYPKVTLAHYYRLLMIFRGFCKGFDKPCCGDQQTSEITLLVCLKKAIFNSAAMKTSLKLSGLRVLELETLQATFEEISVTRTVKIGKVEICNFSSYIRNQLGSTEYRQEEHA